MRQSDSVPLRSSFGEDYRVQAVVCWTQNWRAPGSVPDCPANNSIQTSELTLTLTLCRIPSGPKGEREQMLRVFTETEEEARIVRALTHKKHSSEWLKWQCALAVDLS